MYSIYLFVFVNTVFDYPSIVSCSHDFSRYVDASLSNHYNNSNQLMSNGVESMKISAKSAMEEDSVDGNRSFSDQAVDGGVEGRNVKKLSLAMLPLVFKVGAASTWMIVTMVLAAKSVLLGLILLIFKIAVSAGKVSSFFTGQFIKSQQYQSYNHHQPAPWHHAPPTAHDHNFGKHTIRVVAHVQPHFSEESHLSTDSHYDGSSKYSTIVGGGSGSEFRDEDPRGDEKEELGFRASASRNKGDIYVTAPPTE